MTPFGNAIATYPSRDDFYADYPAAATGWDWQNHGGSAPLGSDIFPDDKRWVITTCHPAHQENGSGPVTAFDRETGEVHVLETSMNYKEAEKKYRR